MISVVIPIYNTPEVWLRNCLESVCRQTESELEILLIDDESTQPHVEKICMEFVKRDARVKYSRVMNRGASAARRYGAEHAHGDYITFVDSDDWVHPDMCRTLYQMIVSGGYDMSEIMGRETQSMLADVEKALDQWDTEQSTGGADAKQDWIGIKDRQEMMEAIFDDSKPGMGWSLWGKMFKTEKWKENCPVHENITRGEDLLALAEYSKAAQSYIISREILYYYNKENVESVTKQDTVKNLTICECYRQLVLLYESTPYKKTAQSIRARYCGALYGGSIHCLYQKYDNYAKISRMMRRELLRYWRDILTNPYMKERGKCLTALIFPYIFVIKRALLSKMKTQK